MNNLFVDWGWSWGWLEFDSSDSFVNSNNLLVELSDDLFQDGDLLQDLWLLWLRSGNVDVSEVNDLLVDDVDLFGVLGDLLN